MVKEDLKFLVKRKEGGVFDRLFILFSRNLISRMGNLVNVRGNLISRIAKFLDFFGDFIC